MYYFLTTKHKLKRQRESISTSARGVEVDKCQDYNALVN